MKPGLFRRAAVLLLPCLALSAANAQAAPPYDVVYTDLPPGSSVNAIYGMNSDGTNRTQIFSHLRDAATDPALSPDGRTIVFTRQISFQRSLWLINSDGSDLRRLTGDDEAFLAAWSPDGKRVAFTSSRGGNADVYAINVSTGAEARLTDHAGADTSAAWSPDGLELVYVSSQDGPTAELYIMNADGSGKRRLTNNPRHEFGPRWGAHGRILFDRQKEGEGSLAGPSELWVIKPDGTGETQLTSTGPEVKNTDATWTADTRQIVYATNNPSADAPDQSIWGIVLMNADGSNSRFIYRTDRPGQSLSGGLSTRQSSRVVYPGFEEMVAVEQVIPAADTHMDPVRMNAAGYVVGTRTKYTSSRGVESQAGFVYHAGRTLVLPTPENTTRASGVNISEVRPDGSMLVLGSARFSDNRTRGILYRITTNIAAGEVTMRVLPNYIYPPGNAYAGESSGVIANLFGPGDVIYGTDAGPGLPKPLRWSPPDYAVAVHMEGPPGDEYSTNVAADGGNILQDGYSGRGSWINHSILVPGTADSDDAGSDADGRAVDLRNGFVAGTRNQSQEPREIGFVWRTEWANLLEFPSFRTETVNAQGHVLGIGVGRASSEDQLPEDLLVRDENSYSRTRVDALLSVRPKFRDGFQERHDVIDLSDANHILEWVRLGAGTSSQREGFMINANANGPGTPQIQVSDRLLAFIGEKMTFQFSAGAGAELNAVALDKATLNTLEVDRASGTVSFTPATSDNKILLVARNENGYATRPANVVIRRRESTLPVPVIGNVRTMIGSAVFLDVSSRESYSYRATGLPPGLTIREFGNGYIEGVPTTPGVYRVTVFVTNNVGTSSASFTIEVAADVESPAYVTSPPRALAQQDVPFSYTVTTAAVARNIEVTGLPFGLLYDHGRRQIYGTAPSEGFFGPANPGTYPVKIRTENSLGVVEFDLTIELLPKRAEGARPFGENVPVGEFNVGNGFVAGGAFATEVQPDGKLLVAGDFGQYNGQPLQRIVRLNENASVDTSFQAGPILGRITAMRVLPDGRILIGGEFNFGGDSPMRGLACLLPNGSVDPSFPSDPGANARIETIQLLADGRIVIGGSTGGTSAMLARRNAKAATDGSSAFLRVLHANGSSDASFNAALPANGVVYAVLPLGDGSVLVGGSFATGGGLVRLDPSGASDASFGGTVDGEVHALASARDGSVFVGGAFSSVSGEARGNLARIQTNGAVLPGFGAAAPVNGAVHALAPDRLGGLFIGGSFSGVGDLGRSGFARLQPDGTVDQQYAVAAGFDGPVESLLLDGAGNVVAAGTFQNAGGAARSGIAKLVGNPIANLANISTRMRVESGENVLIGGFIVQGSATKRVIIRAIGPSLTANGAPLPGRLSDPVLTLYSVDGRELARNDNWRDTQQQAINDSTIAPPDERECAIVFDLTPGAYTAVVGGANSEQGVALVEVYDLQQAAPSRLVNISTRGRVQTGENVMIGGYIVLGERNKTVLIRAIGPSLGAAGIGGAVQDPELQLVDASGNVVVANNDWQQGDQAQAIAATGAAPGDAREAAVIGNLAPGAYTAIVRGTNGTTGVGLVEVYELD